MKKNARRVALVYPDGNQEAQKWLKAQKKSLSQEFAKTEEYALPTGASREEQEELLTALREREGLDEVLTYQRK